MRNYNIVVFFLLALNLSAQDFKSQFTKGHFTSANVSLSVISMEDGSEVIGHRSKKNLIPASSLKLFTTLTSLNILEPNFKFKTSLNYSGEITADGTLKGDIIVKGGGDPTLGSTRIKTTLSFDELMIKFSNAILDKGINCIEGDIIIDESIFDSYPIAPSWQWNDLGNYYATGAWGLNINENLYFLSFDNKDKLGHTPKLKRISPKVENLKISNELKIDSSHTGDQAYIFGGPYNYNKRIVGTIPQGSGHFSIKGSIPDPPLFFGQKLKDILTELNIQLDEVKVNHKVKSTKTNELLSIESPLLQEIVRSANFNSQNLYTEAILKIMGFLERGQGSGQNGIAVIKKQLRKYKVNPSEYLLYDGSGLSARNNISSRAMSRFLYAFANEVKIETAIKFLPRGSYEGTVRNIFKSSSAKGKFWIKSGSMEGVQSYSGYLKSKDNKWYSFSFIVNGFDVSGRTMRKQMEEIMTQIYLQL